MADAIDELEARRESLDYEIDGVVLKVDSFRAQAELGALHERPRWARAYKWAPSTAITRLKAIHIRVGRTGALNPWAELEPVEVGGVTVTSATLHNEDDINRKGHPRGRSGHRSASGGCHSPGRRARPSARAVERSLCDARELPALRRPPS